MNTHVQPFLPETTRKYLMHTAAHATAVYVHRYIAFALMYLRIRVRYA